MSRFLSDLQLFFTEAKIGGGMPFFLVKVKPSLSVQVFYSILKQNQWGKDTYLNTFSFFPLFHSKSIFGPNFPPLYLIYTSSSKKSWKISCKLTQATCYPGRLSKSNLHLRSCCVFSLTFWGWHCSALRNNASISFIICSPSSFPGLGCSLTESYILTNLPLAKSTLNVSSVGLN